MLSNQLYITLGFLLPPKGEAIDLSDYEAHPVHEEYCKHYIENKASADIKQAFKNYMKLERKDLPNIGKLDLYTDFCVKVLGWCKVGNILEPDKKIITCNAQMEWQSKIFEEYQSYGFEFDLITGIELASLFNEGVDNNNKSC